MNPASLSQGDVMLPWAIRTGQQLKNASTDDIQRAILDNLALLASRLAPQPRSQKIVCNLDAFETSANDRKTVDLSGLQYNSVLATVLTGNVAVYFSGSVGTDIDLQFAAGNPVQTFFPPLQNSQVTFLNPDPGASAYAVIWLINY